MDFNWTTDQLDYRQRVVDFAQSELNDDVVARDHQNEFSQANWQRCAEFGIQSLSLPQAYSGRQEVDFLTAILAMEGLGYGAVDNGLTFALNAQVWTVQLPLLRFGSEELKTRYLPPLSRGEIIGAHAITEPTTGSDVFNMKAQAVKVDGGYRLTGHKHYVSLAPIADVALVFAQTDPGAGKWGVSAFLVETASTGVVVGENRPKMGLRTVPFGDIHFDECFVPEENRLGPEGAGVGISTSSLEWERCSILASQIGAMERQLEQCITYAKEREQFGKPIAKYQAVAHRIVDMQLRLSTSRLMLYHVAWLKQTDQPAMIEAALLKLHLSESFVDSSIDAIKVNGGHGYLSASEVERNLRDAIGGTIYAGTSDIQRNIVASLLGL